MYWMYMEFSIHVAGYHILDLNGQWWSLIFLVEGWNDKNADSKGVSEKLKIDNIVYEVLFVVIFVVVAYQDCNEMLLERNPDSQSPNFF